MTTRSPYAIRHTTWLAATRFVPFAASGISEYKAGTLLAEEKLHATTYRGANRQVTKVVRDTVDGATPVAVYWSEKGRSVYVITRTADRVMYCDTYQPVHTSYAQYWDAEQLANTLAAELGKQTRYGITAKAY